MRRLGRGLELINTLRSDLGFGKENASSIPPPSAAPAGLHATDVQAGRGTPRYVSPTQPTYKLAPAAQGGPSQPGSEHAVYTATDPYALTHGGQDSCDVADDV